MANQLTLDQLEIPQLTEAREQLEREVKMFVGSYSQLKLARSKYTGSQEALKEMKSENDNKPLLIPLTNSLYHTARLTQVDKVVVDIGTGYFVEKDVKSANEFYERKLGFIKLQMEKIDETLQTKQNALQQVAAVLQQKKASQNK